MAEKYQTDEKVYVEKIDSFILNILTNRALDEEEVVKILGRMFPEQVVRARFQDLVLKGKLLKQTQP